MQLLSWARGALDRVSPRVFVVGVLLVGYVVFLLYAYPGFTSIDDTVQLAEARSHVYSDWHPPVMAALWTVVELIVRGPLGMLLLQSVAFLAGTYRLCARAMRPQMAAIVSVAILLFPPVLAPMAVIWKDSLAAALLVLGTSCLLDSRRWQRWVGIGLLAAAAAVRYNGAAATLPLLIGFAWRDGARRVWIGGAIWIATVLCAFTANRALTRVQLHAWPASIALPDLVGTLRYSSRRPDAEIRSELAGTPLVPTDNLWRHARQIYTPVLWWDLEHGDRRMFDWPSTEQDAALPRIWARFVLAHPWAYVRQRLDKFEAALALGEPPFDAVCVERAVEDRGLVAPQASSVVQEPVAQALRVVADDTPLFRPWLYLLLALVGAWFARSDREILALFSSGILYELSLLPFAPSADYRYSYWLVVSCLIAGAITLARLRK